VVLPGALAAEPTAHGVHAVQRLAGFASSSHIPAGHGTEPDAPPAQYVPGTQVAHCTGFVLVAGTVWAVPGAHMPAGAHPLELGTAL
jgi:hypothetical protein